MYDLKPDRIVIFYESQDTDWVTLRVVLFHYTIFKTDILDILEIISVEIPLWLERLVKEAQNAEYRPIPEAPFPQSLPTLAVLRQVVPFTIDSGMSFPVWDGFQVAGLAVNPGGEPATWHPYYKARLCSWTFKGLNFWVQSGMLNGALCLASQALLHYRRATQPKVNYPLINLEGYLPGKPFLGAKCWYVPGLQSLGGAACESSFAHNEISYSAGHYSISRNFFTDCPVPSYPEGHFMRPLPGMKMSISTGWGVFGRGRLFLQDSYVDGDSLDTVPFGCQPGWPPDDFLALYGLRNDDDMNLNSLADITGNGVGGRVFSQEGTDNVNFYDVVIDETEEGEDIVLVSPVDAALFIGSLMAKRGLTFYRTQNRSELVLSISGEPLTIAGKQVLV